jgi:ribosomal protein S18 acetylase RimI-like enzyme
MNNLKIMATDLNINPHSKLTTEILEELNARDLSDLVDAMDAAIEAGAGLGWSKAPPRDVVEKYFKGVLLVPERTLFVGRVDGTIASAAQLIAPSRYNTAQQFSANILAIFVAPWARGHGMGRQLLTTVENEALLRGYSVLNLDVRETQKNAIALFEKMNYKLWGTNPHYAEVEGEMIKGLYFGKVINQAHLDSLKK